MCVSEINSLIKTFVRERFYNLCIVGEVSTFRPSANGHWYFKLKDSTSQIDAVMFRSANALCGFVPSDGDKVEVTSRSDGSIIIRKKKKDAAQLKAFGVLHRYANPELIPLEDKAFGMAMEEKYGKEK